MTPEEHFARLRDPSNWTVRAPRPPRRPRRVVAILLPVAIAAVLAIVFISVVQNVRGVQHPQPAVTSPSPAPTPSSAGTLPTLPTEAWASPPAQLFGGDCGVLMPQKLIDGLFPSAKLVDANAARAKPLSAVVSHNGGLRCDWSGGDSSLILFALPTTAVPSAVDSDGCQPMESSDGDCEFTAVEGQVVFTGTMRTADSARFVDGLDAFFAQRVLALHSVPAPWSQRTTDWETSIDCSALLKDADTSSALGSGNWTNLAGDSSSAFPTVDLLDNGHGYDSCNLKLPAETAAPAVRVQTLAGGSWLAAPKGAKAVRVAGADSAYEVTVNDGEGDERELWAVAGQNLLEVDTDERLQARLPDVAAAAIAYLNNRAGITTSAGSELSEKTPALKDLTLSSEGLGPIKVGQPVPTDQKLTYWLDDFCGSGSADAPGGWQNDYPRNSDGHYAFWVEADYGTHGAKKTSPVRSIYVFNPAIRTKHGLHVGSSLADVKALGGVSEKASGGYYDVAWVIHGNAGELVAWVADDRVTSLEVDKEGTKPTDVGEITPCD